MATYNVRGLATHIHHLGERLQGLRETHERGHRAVVSLQETHLNKGEHKTARGQYAAMWGFKYSTADAMSFWASGDGRRAGVAILLNPYGQVRQVQPWEEQQWSEHLMMVTGMIEDQQFLFVNVYAPSAGTERVIFYKHLMQIQFPPDTTMICGGDFLIA